jgi:hypothetical protein
MTFVQAFFDELVKLGAYESMWGAEGRPVDQPMGHYLPRSQRKGGKGYSLVGGRMSQVTGDPSMRRQATVTPGAKVKTPPPPKKKVVKPIT